MVMLNLFIGVISAAMEESMIQLREDAELREQIAENQRAFEVYYNRSLSTTT